MKRLILLALVLAFAAYQGPTVYGGCVPPQGSAFQHETLTVSSTALGFTAGLIDNGSGQASSALVTIAGDAIRFWADGSTPTATVGHAVAVSSSMELCGYANLKNFRMIRQAGDATVSASYFR